MNIESKGSNISSIQEVAKKSIDERIKIMQKTVDPAVLKAFQNDPSAKVRFAVYSNEFTPPKIALKLFDNFFKASVGSKTSLTYIKDLSAPLKKLNCTYISGASVKIIFDILKSALPSDSGYLSAFMKRLYPIFYALSKNPTGYAFISRLYNSMKGDYYFRKYFPIGVASNVGGHANAKRTKKVRQIRLLIRFLKKCSNDSHKLSSKRKV